RVADLIAYINHDIGDAIRASLVHEEGLPHTAVAVLGHGHSQRIHTMVCDIVTQSSGHANITMSPQVKMAADEMRRFLNDRVYQPSLRMADAQKARDTLHFLFDYYLNHDFQSSWTTQLPAESKERRVVDYIAGMTDLYALRAAEGLSRNK
ncbi:MAG: deoxyguanosinetriphosphate triphosphohydrolase, partial [Chloroflexota bacterium]